MVEEKEIIDDEILDLLDCWKGKSVQKKNRISRLIRKIKSIYFYFKIRKLL